jgi:NAD+ synthase (glutamine-hydrolysing)
MLMPAVRVAMAQINPTVGDLSGNSAKILDFAKRAYETGAQIVLFPELALTGYPIEDLALSRDFLSASELALEQLAKAADKAGLGQMTLVVGYPGFAENPTSWAIGANKAALITGGKISGNYAKHHLPNYSVFDEYRVFVPGQDLLTFEVNDMKFATVICEDIWQSGGPVAQISASNVDLILVLNGSPFETSKTDSRLDLVKSLVKAQGTAVAYVNLVGGQDDLVFDGNSFVVDGSGKEIVRARQFSEDLCVFDVESKSKIAPVSISSKPLKPHQQIWDALVLGLKDYVAKNGFKSVTLGLSGGIDSAVCASLAVDALGANNVFGVGMPSKYSSEHSLIDARALAQNTGLVYSEQPIEAMVDTATGELRLDGLAAENLQARIRAVILMGLSNQNGHLVLTTGNKSELAVGYSTIYGDSVGGFAPIKDVEKSLVWALAKHRNEMAVIAGETPPIPESSISKAPSAELRPGQTDQDSLPDYSVLDQILQLHIEQRLSASEITAKGFDRALVDSVLILVKNSEWKRRQGAIGPRITKLAFGRERRMPISNGWS